VVGVGSFRGGARVRSRQPLPGVVHAWPVAEVAAAILPLFAHPPFSPCRNGDLVLDDIVAWCKTGRFAEWKFVRLGANPFTDPDYRAINEAIQVLEQTRLIVHYISRGGDTTCDVGLTRLGWDALQTNTVRQHLGLSDTPPTA
jgi:hypothetical protein